MNETTVTDVGGSTLKFVRRSTDGDFAVIITGFTGVVKTVHVFKPVHADTLADFFAELAGWEVTKSDF